MPASRASPGRWRPLPTRRGGCGRRPTGCSSPHRQSDCTPAMPISGTPAPSPRLKRSGSSIRERRLLRGRPVSGACRLSTRPGGPQIGASLPAGRWGCSRPPIGRPTGSPIVTRARCMTRPSNSICRRPITTARRSAQVSRCAGRYCMARRWGLSNGRSMVGVSATVCLSRGGPTTSSGCMSARMM